MADIEVKAIGKSEAEVAHEMAIEILLNVEGKSFKAIARAEYLNAHVDAVHALRGSRPTGSASRN